MHFLRRVRHSAVTFVILVMIGTAFYCTYNPSNSYISSSQIRTLMSSVMKFFFVDEAKVLIFRLLREVFEDLMTL